VGTNGDERAFGLDFDAGSEILEDTSKGSHLLNRFRAKPQREFLRQRNRGGFFCWSGYHKDKMTLFKLLLSNLTI
jgi:hypothetical protein